jgi:hypothetical protein
MKIQNFNDYFPYIIIDDYYNEGELRLIWEELEFLSYPHKLKRATAAAGGATDPDSGKLLKKNFHRYIDGIYCERELSNILTVNRKLFEDEYKIMRQHPHWFFKHIYINEDYTQIGYYENNDEYGEHHDLSTITSLTWLYKEPKRFVGGDLFIGPDKIKIDCVNNRTLIFPSMMMHSVNEIHMNPEYQNKRNGRYVISQFGNVATKKPVHQ